MNRFGFDDLQWEAAKAEGKAILAQYAARRQMIPYSDFVKEIRSILLEAHDLRLNHLLGEISAEEDANGRGMLSALVVHSMVTINQVPGFLSWQTISGGTHRTL